MQQVYFGSPLTDEDECLDAAQNGKLKSLCCEPYLCNNTRGSYSCVCPAGTEPSDSDDTCIGKLESTEFICFICLSILDSFIYKSMACNDHLMPTLFIYLRLHNQLITAGTHKIAQPHHDIYS